VFKDSPKVIINHQEDHIRKEFGNTDHSMIPFQAVTLIKEIIRPEEKKVTPFSLVKEEKKGKK
jgi:hypothetical protein